MTQDHHAAYLTDPGVMTAARARATQYGEDGWAAAATLAPTMPPASFTSYEAFGAREILAPGTVLTETELDRLEEAATHGYYGDPNLSETNHDLVGSMVRPAESTRKIRPDLICPSCCEKAGRPEETGVQLQEYRCTECGELWKYIPSVDSDEQYFSASRFSVDPGFESRMAGMSVAMQRIAESFGVLGELVGIDQTLWVAFEPAESEEIADREIRARIELRSVLEMADRNQLVDQVSRLAGIDEARSRGLIGVMPPVVRADGRGYQSARLTLTPRGRFMLRQLRRERV